MRIGKLDKRIMVTSVTRTPDGMGGFTEVQTVTRTTWAGVRTLSAGESLNYGLELGQRNLEFTIRQAGPMDQSNAIRYADRDFKVKSVIDPDEKGWMYKVIASERTD